MKDFRIWCPATNDVELVANGNVTRLLPIGHGWYRAPGVDPVAGMRYGYSLHGGKPLPDPRSESQPDGVHALSEVIDHSRFNWTDHGWQARPLPSAIIYELHIGTFTPE